MFVILRSPLGVYSAYSPQVCPYIYIYILFYTVHVYAPHFIMSPHGNIHHIFMEQAALLTRLGDFSKQLEQLQEEQLFFLRKPSARGTDESHDEEGISPFVPPFSYCCHPQTEALEAVTVLAQRRNALARNESQNVMICVQEQ